MLALLLLLFALAYVFCLRGRKGQPGLKALQGWSYAHRGLHGPDRPENSLSAFRAALEAGYGIELDVHLLRDGGLAVIHDYKLERTTGAEGTVEELTASELENYRLEGTREAIPTLQQVLELFNGSAPLIVELKAHGNNYAALCQAACDALKEYPGVYCVESFDPRCVYWLKKHAPHIIRGQLAENFLKKKGGPIPWLLRFCLTCQLFNAVTRPDFVAYKFTDRKRLGNTLVRKLWGIQGVAWTLKNPSEHQRALAEGWIPIFEAYMP